MVNRIKLSLLFFLFTSAIFFEGCYKDNVVFNPYTPTEEVEKGDINEFFAEVQDKAISEEISAEEQQYVLTANNTIFEIPGNSFTDEEGNPISGNIEFKYIELLDPALYSFYNLPTISNGKLLRTDGVFRFEAFQDGENINLKPGAKITVRLPDETPEPGMELFYGQGEGESFNWVLATEITSGTDAPIRINEWGVELDSLQNWVTGFGYEFEADLFTWINVDIFNDVPDSEKTTVCVELPEEYTNKNTLVFMYFKDIKSILALHGDANAKLFCESYGATPIGYEVKFIIISNQGEDIFHFAIEDAVIEENHLQSMFPEEKSIDEIIDIIKNL